MKFTRTKFSGLDGQTKVRFTVDGDENSFVEASGAGVKVQLNLQGSSAEWKEPFAKVIGDSWKDHLSLKPQIAMSATGH